MIWPHIHSMRDVYQIVGSLVIGWIANSIVDWIKHSFWTGFKAGLKEQIRLGRPLTQQERAGILKQVNNQLTVEFSKKLMGVAEVADN